MDPSLSLSYALRFTPPPRPDGPDPSDGLRPLLAALVHTHRPALTIELLHGPREPDPALRHAINECAPPGATLLALDPSDPDALPALPPGQEIDLLILHAALPDDQLRQRLHAWLPRLRPGGLLLLPGIALPRDGHTPRRIWDELRRTFPQSFHYPHATGLGLLLQPSDLPPSGLLARLLASPGSPDAHLLTQLFLTAAEALHARHTLPQQTTLIHHLQRLASQRSHALATLAHRLVPAPLRLLRHLWSRRPARLLPPPLPDPALADPGLCHITAPLDWTSAPAKGLITLRPTPGPGPQPPVLALRAHIGNQIWAARPDLPADPTCATYSIPYSLSGPHPRPVRIESLLPTGKWAVLARRTLQPRDPSSAYDRWLLAEHTRNPVPSPPAPDGPLISIIVPIYNTPEKWLRLAIRSVLAQTYPNWQLCLADDASTAPHVQSVLEEHRALDPRILTLRRPTNGHISAASNSALSLATGDYIALLDHDDELAPHALATIVHTLRQHPGASLLYSDEDKIDPEGRRHTPHFKTSWNPDLLLGQNYICHLAVYRAGLIRSIGGFRTGCEGAQDWDLALRATANLDPAQIIHIPRILYHWRTIPGSTALNLDQKDYHLDAARDALEHHLHATTPPGHPVPQAQPVPGQHWRVIHPLPRPPTVSIIIPTRNHLHILRPCLETLVARTTYPDYEILLVDNNSDDPATLAYLEQLTRPPHLHPRLRLLRDPGPFNYSAINNRAAAQATGTLLAFLNNDIAPLTPAWLEEMASQALRPGAGAIGALLLYPDNHVQHAGILLTPPAPDHAFRHIPHGRGGYMNRLRLVQNYSAVTAACLVIRKELFHQSGGFDETSLPVSYNDVDLCLRLNTLGHRTIWTPFAVLHHHESASRGGDTTPEKQARTARELAHLRATWPDHFHRDPAYNPNLTPSPPDFTPA